MKMKKILFLALIAAAWLPGQARSVVVISHRGEHLHHPENTMPAFQEAVRVGADYIEVDVRTTSDGKLVLMHDASADRTTNGKGEIAKMTFDEVRALNAGGGARVPTFDEVLDYARGKINIYVDVKQVTAQDLVGHIARHGMNDNVVIYSGRISKEVQDLNPKPEGYAGSRQSGIWPHSLINQLHPQGAGFRRE